MTKSEYRFLSSLIFLIIHFPSCYVFGQETEPVVLQSSSDFTVLYHEKSQSLLVDIYSANNKISGKIPLEWSQLSFLLETDIQLNRYKTSKNNIDFQLGTSQNNLSLFWKIKYRAFLIEPGISLSVSDFGNKVGGGISAGWQPNHTDQISLSWFNRKHSYFHSWKAEDSEALFNQWSDITDLKLSGSFLFSDKFQIEGNFRKSDYSTGSATEEFSEQATYNNSSYGTKLIYYPVASTDIWIQFSNFSGNGNPEFQFQKTPFSSVQGSKVSDRFFSAGLKSGINSKWDAGSEFSIRDQSLSSSGLLQSFPFAPGVISILGDYYFFSVDGKIKTDELLFSGSFHFQENQSLTLKTGYQLIEPDLFLQTWEPLFFTIGRKNEQTTQLDFTKLHIIPLTIQWQFEFKQFSFDLSVNQLIPVYSEKRINSAKSDEGTGNTSSGNENKQSNKFVWGGTELKLNISWIW